MLVLILYFKIVPFLTVDLVMWRNVSKSAFIFGTGLSAGESDWSYEFSFFKVGIDLTDAGHGQLSYLISSFVWLG